MIFELFTDPITRGPVWAGIFMGMASGLLGAIVYLKKEALVGEVLSHACYPGIMLAVMLFPWLWSLGNETFEMLVLLGAFFSSYLGLNLLSLLKKRYHLSEDISLTFTLSGFLQWVFYCLLNCNLVIPPFIKRV